MATTTSPPAAVSLRRRTTLTAAAVLLLATGALGFALGSLWTSHSAELGGWHTGVGRVGADQVSIDYGGWTYGVSDSVAWLDQGGTWHDDGWPTCLRDHVGDALDVRFQAREVTVDGTTWRPVVAIDCQGTTPTTAG